jgi:hypothetical protein
VLYLTGCESKQIACGIGGDNIERNFPFRCRRSFATTQHIRPRDWIDHGAFQTESKRIFSFDQKAASMQSATVLWPWTRFRPCPKCNILQLGSESPRGGLFGPDPCMLAERSSLLCLISKGREARRDCCMHYESSNLLPSSRLFDSLLYGAEGIALCSMKAVLMLKTAAAAHPSVLLSCIE